jgi:CHAT domain-containing protein
MHIAVHSNAETGRAALWLADDELTADTIADHMIAPRLAVVATCQSKTGDDPASSLVAAFLAAGASGAIGSKRTLVDRDTATLMHDFYANHGAVDPARALATAQRAAIAANRAVSSWASISFFGVGGWMELSRSQ